jgi:predicted P-loop ATPase
MAKKKSEADKLEEENYQEDGPPSATSKFDEHPKSKVPIANQRNIHIALLKLGVRLWHDQFAGRLMIDNLDGFGPELDDEAVDRLWLRIDTEYGFRAAKEFFYTVIRDVARRNSFHPVLDYLDGLKWDGTPRVDRWLIDYAGAKDSAYVTAVSSLMLIAAVRRVRQPGCKFDEMLVLKSPQGHDKSSALRVLAVKDEWFTDELPLSADTKQVIEALDGRWIVEVGELK